MHHGWHAGRRGAVGEHRRLEIARGKHLGDVLQVFANLLAARGVFGVVHFDFNGSPVFEEAEMVRRFCLRETHGLVSALLYLALMVAMVLRRILLLRLPRWAKRQDCQQRCYPHRLPSLLSLRSRVSRLPS